MRSQIVFALRAVQYPASIPVSLASLTLITETATRFSYTLQILFTQTGSIAEQFETVRKLYDVGNIRNKVADGTVSYPEDSRKASAGITLEFR